MKVINYFHILKSNGLFSVPIFSLLSGLAIDDHFLFPTSLQDLIFSHFFGFLPGLFFCIPLFTSQVVSFRL